VLGFDIAPLRAAMKHGTQEEGNPASDVWRDAESPSSSASEGISSRCAACHRRASASSQQPAASKSQRQRSPRAGGCAAHHGPANALLCSARPDIDRHPGAASRPPPLPDSAARLGCPGSAPRTPRLGIFRHCAGCVG